MKLKMLGLLEKLIEMADHNVFCYSRNWAMTQPKEDFEKQWQEAKDELDILIHITRLVEKCENTLIGNTLNTAKQKRGMTFDEIKHELTSQGITLDEIAKMAGVTVSCVYQTMREYESSHQYKGRRIRPYIAQVLGIPQDKIWPPEEQQLAQ